MLMPMLGLNGVVPQCALSTLCTLFTGVANCLPECDVPVPEIPSSGNFSAFWWYRKNLVPEKSLGASIGKIWNRNKRLGTSIGKKLYKKKVSELVSEKFGAEKYRCGIGI